jgi:hypothetical protein
MEGQGALVRRDDVKPVPKGCSDVAGRRFRLGTVQRRHFDDQIDWCDRKCRRDVGVGANDSAFGVTPAACRGQAV